MAIHKHHVKDYRKFKKKIGNNYLAFEKILENEEGYKKTMIREK